MKSRSERPLGRHEHDRAVADFARAVAESPAAVAARVRDVLTGQFGVEAQSVARRVLLDPGANKAARLVAIAGQQAWRITRDAARAAYDRASSNERGALKALLYPIAASARAEADRGGVAREPPAHAHGKWRHSEAFSGSGVQLRYRGGASTPRPARREAVPAGMRSIGPGVFVPTIKRK